LSLSLGVKVRDSVFAGNYVIDVLNTSKNTISIRCGQRTFHISEHSYVEVAPSVLVRRGRSPTSTSTYPRLDIRAPKAIKISLYRRDRSVKLQGRLVHLCVMVANGHEWPKRVLERLCAKSHRARRALEAILADPRSPRFGDEWTSRFKYLVAYPPRPVQGGLPGLGRRR
jgi:hypothetical protein